MAGREPLELRSAPAAESFFAAPTIGTLGVGLEAGYVINPRFRVRLRGNWIAYEFNRERCGIDFKARAQNRSASLLLDYHPWEGAFRWTAGALVSDMNAQVSGSTHGDSFTLGDNTFQGEGNICVRGKYTWNKVQPYIGFGWSTEGMGESLWYWTVDVGVAILGNGKLTTSSSGKITDGNGHPVDSGQIHESIRQEAHEVLKMCDRVHLYPVLQIGAGYRF